MQKSAFVLFFALLLLFAGCGSTGSGSAPASAETPSLPVSAPEAEAAGPSDLPSASEAPEETEAPETQSPAREEEETEESAMSEEPVLRMTLGETEVPVRWEENAAAEALRELAKEAPLVIRMSMYGGFEQVGPLGASLPRDDVQTVTRAGDIVLYSGDRIVVFYGSNSWAYTRLGQIEKTPEELKELLGNGDITLTLEWK